MRKALVSADYPITSAILIAILVLFLAAWVGVAFPLLVTEKGMRWIARGIDTRVRSCYSFSLEKITRFLGDLP